MRVGYAAGRWVDGRAVIDADLTFDVVDFAALTALNFSTPAASSSTLRVNALISRVVGTPI